MLEAKEAEREAASRRAAPPEELERRARLEGLMLSRARVTAELAAARDDRHRALLQRSLEHLDAALAAFDDAP
jgi:hypothetical protein